MKKTRRGSTLVELCLVIAISAVVFAMIASFAVLIQYRAVASEEDYGAVREINSVRTAIFDWLKDHDSPDATISTHGGTKLTISNTLEEIELEEGWFKSPTFYDKVSQIESVEFIHAVLGKIPRSGGEGPIQRDLLKVRITYKTSSESGLTAELLFATYASILG